MKATDANRSSYNNNGALMNPLYSGMTCPIPATGDYANGTCTQGGYAEYAVEVSNVAQIQLAVNLARSLNLRLVVHNTGHDYNGRSAGKGALSIWTHNLKEIRYIEGYQGTTYFGPVFKVGAGLQAFELYQAADRYGVSAVAGICPTIGVYGGYSAGGGHSPLMQLFGVGSDQVVALEVVTANGRFVTATPTVNRDLYWALLGGGGGTFGIVTSAVVKVHRKVPVTTSTWNLATSESVSSDAFWDAFRFFFDSFPMYNAARTYSYFSIAKTAPGAYTWTMQPFFATEKTVEEYGALIQPFYKKCASLGIHLNANTTHYHSFYPAYQATFGTLNYRIGAARATPGNRILPIENWSEENIRNETFAAIKTAVNNAFMLLMYHQHPAEPESRDINSVNLAFRNEQSMIVTLNRITDQSAAGWKAGAEQLNTQVLGPLREVSPLGGTYGNEAYVDEPDWHDAFWGRNYPRLLAIKKEVDPTGLFYVHHGVGSEEWFVDDKGIVGVQSGDGPLCRA